jgi:hypothetical protein
MAGVDPPDPGELGHTSRILRYNPVPEYTVLYSGTPLNRKEIRTLMRIRPGKTRSLIGGILMLVVMIVGLMMMPGDMGIGGPVGGAVSIFKILWVAFGLIGAAASFYNAFSEKGVPLYEVDMEGELESEAAASVL